MSHAGTPTLKESHYTLKKDSGWRRLPMIAGAIGVLGIAASLGLGLTGGEAMQEQFYFSYLTAFAYTLSLALGGLFFVLVQFVTRAGWSVGVRRIAENIMGTLPVFILLAIPVMLGVDTLYHHWVHAPPTDELVEAKRAYLNKPFFYIRAVIYLAVWSILAYLFYRASTRQDETGNKETTRKLQMYSAPALVLFALTTTFAAIDWLMSLNPHWFSTIWGVYFFAGSAVGIFALMSVLVVAFRKSDLLGPASTTEHDHDLGKMLFGFVVFWSYIAFSQYMLIWYAQIPEETVYFADRMFITDTSGPEWTKNYTTWYYATIALAVGHFILPFFFLMSRHIKRNAKTLVAGAVYMLVLHYVDLYWVVMPTLHTDAVQPHLLDLTTLVGTLGIFFAAFGWLLTRSNLVPIKDPRLPEALEFENY